MWIEFNTNSEDEGTGFLLHYNAVRSMQIFTAKLILKEFKIFTVRQILRYRLIRNSFTGPIEQLSMNMDGKIYTFETSSINCEQYGGHLAAINYVQVTCHIQNQKV